MVAAVRALSLDAFSPLVAWVSFTPYVAVLLVVGAGLAFAWHARAAAGVMLVMGFVLVALVAPRTVEKNSGGSVDHVGASYTKILSANLLKGHASPRAFTQLVRASDPDVVAMQELTPEFWASIVRDGGIGEAYRYRWAQPQAQRNGFGIMSRHPLKKLIPKDPSLTELIWPEFALGGTPISLRTIHPSPPVAPVSTRGWQRNLSELPAAEGVNENGDRWHHDRLRVVAGDFNATLDHREFRRLLDRGFVDAGNEKGAGMTPTWEGDFFRLTIDHIVVDDHLDVVDYSVHDLPGSDHNAVFAELRWD